MIDRHWHGLAKTSEAKRYVEHLRTETFPQLAHLAGFIDASILERFVPEGVEFLIVTRWDSLDAIRAFAGSDPERAVVPEKVQSMMVRYDVRAIHYEVLN